MTATTVLYSLTSFLTLHCTGGERSMVLWRLKITNVSTDFRCGGALCFTSKADDLFSYHPQYTGYPPKLTIRTPPPPNIKLFRTLTSLSQEGEAAYTYNLPLWINHHTRTLPTQYKLFRNLTSLSQQGEGACTYTFPSKLSPKECLPWGAPNALWLRIWVWLGKRLCLLYRTIHSYRFNHFLPVSSNHSIS